MLGSELLQNTRIRFTAVTIDDLPTIARWHQDAAFVRMFEANPAVPKAPVVLESWLDSYTRSNTGYLFGLRLIDRDELIGFVELDSILWAHRHSWLSIAIGDAANRGRGYGTAALTLALQFAFQELNLHRVQLTVFSYNQRAIALYEKIGFQREGIFREHIQRDGQRFDMYLYGILRPEWLAHQSAEAPHVDIHVSQAIV